MPSSSRRCRGWPGARRHERRARQPGRPRKLRDAAILLPLAGLILLMPPAAGVVALPLQLLGVPLPVAYVFAIWAGLIVAARIIGGRLDRADRGP
jgi:hypothetical protein